MGGGRILTTTLWSLFKFKSRFSHTRRHWWGHWSRHIELQLHWWTGWRCRQVLRSFLPRVRWTRHAQVSWFIVFIRYISRWWFEFGSSCSRSLRRWRHLLTQQRYIFYAFQFTGVTKKPIHKKKPSKLCWLTMTYRWHKSKNNKHELTGNNVFHPAPSWGCLLCNSNVRPWTFCRNS